MLTCALMISVVPFSAMAEDGERTKVSFAFSNRERVDYGHTRTDEGTQWNHYSSPLYMRPSYPAFAQIDLSGYEEVLKNESTVVYMDIARHGTNTSYSIGSFDVYLAADNCDQLSFLDNTTFNHNIAVSSGFTNVDRPILFSREDSTGTGFYSSGELVPTSLVTVLDENPTNSKIALYMKTRGLNSRLGVSSTNFSIIYDEAEINNQEYVDGLVSKLAQYVNSVVEQGDAGSDLTLPQKFYGANVEWISSSVPEVIDPVSGVITPNPTADTPVTLSARLTYTNFSGEIKSADVPSFAVTVAKPKFDYSTITGTYYDGDLGFPNPSGGSSATHSATITKVKDGIAGKDKSDSYYKIQDADGNRRYDFDAPQGKTVLDRDIFEFSICVPEGCYGYYPQLTLYPDKDNLGEDTAANSEFSFKTDGVYDKRNGNKLLFPWDGTKWHHVAIIAPGIISSDASGIVYDRTIKIYVDGVLKDNIPLTEGNYPAPCGIKYVRTNGLCPLEDYNDGDGWQTVACYLDNIRWTCGDIEDIEDILLYNGKSAVTADSYGIDTKGNTLTIMGNAPTVETVLNSITKAKDANARMYDAGWNLIEDKTQPVADGYTLVVAYANGTTSERTYSYYTIRVVGDEDFAFDVPYITEADGNVTGTVKLFNNSGETKTYKVFLAVYNEDKELVEVKPADLVVENGTFGDINTAGIAFEKGNTAKLFVWGEDEITPALTSVSYK